MEQLQFLDDRTLVSTASAKNVVKITLADEPLVQTATLKKFVSEIIINPTTKTLDVATYDDTVLTILDAFTLEEVATIDLLEKIRSFHSKNNKIMNIDTTRFSVEKHGDIVLLATANGFYFLSPTNYDVLSWVPEIHQFAPLIIPSRDGQLFAMTTQDNKIELRSTKNGELINSIGMTVEAYGRRLDLIDIDWSPDGEKLALKFDGQLVIWNHVRGSTQNLAHRFSPTNWVDSSTIALLTTDHEREVYSAIYNIDTKEIIELPVEGGHISTCFSTKTGNRLLCSTHENLFVIDRETMQVITTIEAQSKNEAFTAMIALQDFSLIATTTQPSRDLHVHRVKRQWNQ